MAWVGVLPFHRTRILVVLPDVSNELYPKVVDRRKHSARNDIALYCGEPQGRSDDLSETLHPLVLVAPKHCLQ
jgi:hypothetical protein